MLCSGNFRIHASSLIYTHISRARVQGQSSSNSSARGTNQIGDWRLLGFDVGQTGTVDSAGRPHRDTNRRTQGRASELRLVGEQFNSRILSRGKTPNKGQRQPLHGSATLSRRSKFSVSPPQIRPSFSYRLVQMRLNNRDRPFKITPTALQQLLDFRFIGVLWII